MSNDGNKSTKRAPFTIFSSSAEGGYLDDLHANFTDGVTLANMHTDTYGDFRNPPMQGPFTEKHVGGMPHRHTKIILAGDLEFITASIDAAEGYWDETPVYVTPLTASVSTDTVWELDGSGDLTPLDSPTDNTIWELVDADTALSPGEPDISSHWRVYKTDCKPEGFYIVPAASELNLYGPDFRSDVPRSWLYRDEFAKRPLNIRNIKTDEKCNGVGNFSQEYEVVQIAGRTLNPRHYAEYPEQYTTNYALNYGTEGKVFNNLTGALNTPATGTLPDYELPNSSSLNKFIFVNRFSAPGDRYTMSRGFLNPHGEEMSVYNASPFRNLNVRKELSEDLATHTPKATDIPPDSPTKYHTTNRNPRLRKEIIYGVDRSGWDYTPADELPDSGAGPEGCTDITSCNYTVNAIADNGSCVYGTCPDIDNVVDGFAYDNAYATHAIPRSTLQYSWVTASAETTRSEFPGFATGSDIQFYSNSVGFTNTTYSDTPLGELEAVDSYEFNYIREFAGAAPTPVGPFGVDVEVTVSPAWLTTIDVEYDGGTGGEIVFSGTPSAADVGIHSVEIEYPGSWPFYPSWSDSFDIEVLSSFPPGTYTTNWCPLNNVYINPAAGVQSFDFVDSAYTYGTWKEIRGGELALSRYYRNHNILPVANAKDEVSQYIEPPVVARNFPLEFIVAIDKSGAPFRIRSAYGSMLQRYSNEEINKLFDITTSDKNTRYSQIKQLYLDKSVTDANNPIKAFYSLTYGQTLYPKDENAFMGKVRLRGKYTEIPGTGSRGYDRLYGTQNKMYSTTLMRDPTAENSQGNVDISLAFDPMRTDGILSFPDSGSYSGNVGELNLDTDISLTSSTAPTSSLDYFETNYIRINETSSDYNERLVEQMSGKTRWYDSYEDYAENARGIMKEASILPEFRISEHMEYYTNEAAGNFRAENKDFLSLLGAEYSSSAESATSVTFDADFENTYLDSDGLASLDKIKKDHIGYAKPSKITLKASGVKKLLPYNGFYPDTRTVQLGNLLSSSLEGAIKGYKFDPSNPNLEEEFIEKGSEYGYAPILKSLMSPGILQNTCKAGISVDYPIYSTYPETSSLGEYAPLGPLCLSITSSAIATRLPFETLVNFNGNLPTDTKFHYVSSGARDKEDTLLLSSSLYYGKWSGKSKPNFEIATHNFLAESVSFFLKDSKLNSFISTPEASFADLVPDKIYCMDVVLRDTISMNKFVEYCAESSSFPAYELIDQGAGINNEGYDPPSSAAGTRVTSVAAASTGGAYTLYSTPDTLVSATEKSETVYLVYTSPSGESTLLQEIPPQDTSQYGAFGHSLSMVSGSDALYFVIGAPKVDTTVPGMFGPCLGASGSIDRWAPAVAEITGEVYLYKYEHPTDTLTVIDTLVGGNPLGAFSGNPWNYWIYLKNRTDTLEGGEESTCFESQDIYLESYNNGNSVSIASASDGLYMAHTNGHFAFYDNGMAPLPQYPDHDAGWVAVHAHKYVPDTGDFTTAWSIIPEYSSSISHHNGPVVSLSVGDSYGVTGKVGVIVGTPNRNGNTNAGHFTALFSDGIPSYSSSFDIEHSQSTSDTLSVGSVGSLSFKQGSSENFFFSVGTCEYSNVDTSIDIYRTSSSPAVGTWGNIYNQVEQGDGNQGHGAVHSFASAPQGTFAGLPNRAHLTWPSREGALTPNHLRMLELQLPAATQVSYCTVINAEDINPKPETLDRAGAWPYFGQGLSVDINSSKRRFLTCGQPSYEFEDSTHTLGNVHLIYNAPRPTCFSQHGRLFGLPTEGYYDPAYCSYTPPGFYGETVATLSFSSSVGGSVNLDEILSSLDIRERTNVADGKVSTQGGENVTLTTEQQSIAMSVSSSVNLSGKVIQPSVQFSISSDGSTTSPDRATSQPSDAPRWAISTRYECPVINNSSSAYMENYSSHIAGIEAQIGESSSWAPPRSPWTSYGTPIGSDTGYYFELRETPPALYPTGGFGTPGSLIELCGFTAGTKKIGTVADKKAISEAIMVIPYVDRKIPFKTVEIEKGKHFIRFSKTELRRQKKNVEDKGYAISEDNPTTSISELISGMKNYVIPPQYNFLQYDDIKPFAAYFLEFDHELSQRDLIDIWQGVMPTIAMNPETDEVEITHNFDAHNFFHNMEFPTDIKFMVFKVKKKANWNYYSITTDSTDDTRFKFDFQGDGKVEVVPDYNYNWPYDYCSLVDRAKVDVSITFEKDEKEEVK